MADDRFDCCRSYHGICARLILRDIQGQLIGKHATRAMFLYPYVPMRNGKYSYRRSSDAQGINTWCSLGSAYGWSSLQHGKHPRHQ